MSSQGVHPIERIVRYGFSGVVVSLAFSLGIAGFVHIGVSPVGASVLAFCAVQPLGYALHKMFTFPDTATMATGARAGMRRFIITNLTSLAIATGGMALVTNVLRASYLWGIALNWILIPCTSFMLYRYWVFEVRSPDGGNSA
jgi:putative flippase GtrA